MRRISVRLVAGALVALCWAGGMTGGAAAAPGGQTIAEAPGIKLGSVVRAKLYDGAFYSGYSVAYWTPSFEKGDRITIRTAAKRGETPPCQLMFMPGTDDINVGATQPVLDPSTQVRRGSRDLTRWVATEDGQYVLAMTNNDVFLSGPQQCLSASPGRPFTFTVKVDHRGSGQEPARSTGPDAGSGSERPSTLVVAPGQSLWVIAQGLVAEPSSIAQVALKVDRLWELNAERIGSGNRDLIYSGVKLRFK